VPLHQGDGTTSCGCAALCIETASACTSGRPTCTLATRPLLPTSMSPLPLGGSVGKRRAVRHDSVTCKQGGGGAEWSWRAVGGLGR
jgi:hypothetical protein